MLKIRPTFVPFVFLLACGLFNLPSLEANQSSSFPFLGHSTFQTGNTEITNLEFLSGNVVKFESTAGISVWKLDTGEALVSESRPTEALAIDYDLESDTVLYIDSGALYIRSASNPPIPLGSPDREYTEACFTSDGKGVLAISSQTTNISVAHFSAADGSLSWRDYAPPASEYVLLKDSGRIAKLWSESSTIWHNRLLLLDETDGRTTVSVDVSDAKMKDFSRSYIDPQNRLIVASGQGSRIYIANAVSDTIQSNTFGVLTRFIPSIGPQISADGSRIILRLGDSLQSTLILDTTSGKTIAVFDDFLVNVPQFFQTKHTLSPNGNSLYILVSPGRIEKWSIVTKTLLDTFTYTNVPFTHILVTPDESSLIAIRSSGREDNFVVAFNTSDGSQRYTLQHKSGFTLQSSGFVIGDSQSIALSPDGSIFYFRSGSSSTFFAVEDAQPLELLPSTNGKVLGASFVADRGNYLFIFSNGTIEERDGEDFELISSSLYSNFKYTIA